MQISLDWQWSPRQDQALSAEESFLLYGGAKGGGKTVWISRWAVTECAKYRGNKGWLGRRRGVDFNNTTLDTFRRYIDPRIYRINEQKKKIFLPWCDGVIDYGGLDDPQEIQKFNSAEYGFFGVDQAEEMEKNHFAMLRGTLRYKLPSGEFPKYKGRLTANPAQGWLKDDFILNPHAGHRFIQALPTDNPFLAPTYIQNLREAFGHRPDLLAAYLEGSWDDLSSADICIQGKHVEAARKKIFGGTVLKRIVVNDPARFADDENVIYVMELTEEGVRIADKFYFSNKSTMETAGWLAALRRKHRASLIVVDAIGLGVGVCDALDELGEPVHRLVSSARPTIHIQELRYANLRAQIWMEAGKKFAENLCSLPADDSYLSGQLQSIKFKFSSNGRMVVESKEEIKSRLSRSPDRADCYVMGLHGLDVAGRLDEEAEAEKFHDRQGYGTPIINHQIVDDFSGYGGIPSE